MDLSHLQFASSDCICIELISLCSSHLIFKLNQKFRNNKLQVVLDEPRASRSFPTMLDAILRATFGIKTDLYEDSM